MNITRAVAHISDELAEELGLIACESCGHWFAPEQIRYTDSARFHPKCPVHWEEWSEQHNAEADTEEQTRKYWEWRNSR